MYFRMKGCSALQKYKKHQHTLYLQFIRNRYKVRRRKSFRLIQQKNYSTYGDEIPIKAPQNFCLLENPYECTKFFAKMRSAYDNKRYNTILLNLDLSEVIKLDFSTVVLFKAVNRELTNRGVLIKGCFPDNADCRQFLVDAGFLKDLYDKTGNKFASNGKSVILKIEKGNGILTTKQSESISKLLRESSIHLLGYCIPQIRLKSVLKEICGNSIEWGNAFSKFWMIGIKYEKNKVVFVATDLGQGILNSLRRKFTTKVIDWFSKNDMEVLQGAFDRKYGSASTDVNRNNGLPSIKALNVDKKVEKLCVLTNNVLLDFDDMNKSIIFANKRNAFRGTLYTWELNVNCMQD